VISVSDFPFSLFPPPPDIHAEVLSLTVFTQCCTLMCAILSTTNSLAASHYSERRTLKKIKNKCHRGGGCVAGTPPSSPCFKNNLRKTFFSCLLVFSAVHFVSFLLSLSFVNCIGEVGSQFSECEADAARIAISHSERRKRRPVGRPPLLFFYGNGCAHHFASPFAINFLKIIGSLFQLFPLSPFSFFLSFAEIVSI
jgi:hypothetical protein